MDSEIIKNNFNPPVYLHNAHIQTVWGKLFRKPQKLNCQRERIELPDGDFIDIDWSISGEKALVIVMHGLGGSIDSHYANGIVARLIKENYKVCFKHSRACSNVVNRKAVFSHAGYTKDLTYLVELLRERYPQLPIFIIGYSLNGNKLLKWLAEDNNVCAAVAISVPFDLSLSSHYIPRLYQDYLLKKLKIITRRWQDKQLLPISINLKSIKTIYQFDDKVLAPIHGFKNAEDYYQQSSCRNFLPLIKSPTLIIHSKDDPFVDPAAIPQQNELSSSTNFMLTNYGGHVGFVGQEQRQFIYWSDDKIIEYINGCLR